MKINQLLILLLCIALIGVLGCKDDSEYSNIPYIEFQDLSFLERVDSADQLSITFWLEDGDRNFGIDYYENQNEFAPYFYVIYEYESNYYIVTYGDSLATPPFYVTSSSATLEDYSVDEIPEFNCRDWVAREYDIWDGATSIDTFWVVRNKYYSNLFLDFYKKENGVFKQISVGDDLGLTDCSGEDIHLRVPVYAVDHRIPLLKSYTQKLSSNGFRELFGNDTFKIKFSVVDRDLNESNVAESPEFTIFDILKE